MMHYQCRSNSIGRRCYRHNKVKRPQVQWNADRIFKAASGKRLEKYPPNTPVSWPYCGWQWCDSRWNSSCFYAFPAFLYTENVVEIQAHGGIQSLKKILSLTYEAGARPAEPGEFTKRAFLNGRIDLAQDEAVMDIISRSGFLWNLLYVSSRGNFPKNWFIS